MKNVLGYDVIVIGGGSAGVAATVAAAATGARVALIESHAYLGGKATASHVGTVCGFYLRNEENRLTLASSGFPRIFEERLRQRCNTNAQCHKNGLWYLPYHPFDFKRLCDLLIMESKSSLYLHTCLSGVILDGNKISGIRAISYDREVLINASAVIDCTGEALVAELSGTETRECDEYQSSAQVFTMDGVEAPGPAQIDLQLIREIRKAVAENRLDNMFSGISIVPGSHHKNSISIKINIPEKVTNKINKITPIELMARGMIENISKFLSENVSAFRNARISSIAPEAGIRTGRRLIGCEELTEDAVLSCRKTTDGIANGAWPVELWHLGSRVNMQFFAADDYYHIPAGCLKSKEISNLYFAGRHISATNTAIASARVIGTCLATGYAAGRLASASVAGKPYDHTIEEIRKEQVIL